MKNLAKWLAVVGFAALPAASAAAASPGAPINRWSVEGMRANRLVRPSDLYRRPPVRTYRKVKRAPAQKPRLEAPTYGLPEPAIERIPPT
jgi:hypothetical protein